MDLYEALKAGTSAEDLLKAFHDDLNKANARIAEEKAAAEERHLDECRALLAEAVLDYAEALLGEIDGTYTTKEIKEVLKDFEKEMKPTLDFCEKLNKYTKDDDNLKNLFDTDDDIINTFLNKLK